MSCECQPHCTSCTLTFNPVEATCDSCEEGFLYKWNTNCYESCPDFVDGSSGDFSYVCTDVCESPNVVLTLGDYTECR